MADPTITLQPVNDKRSLRRYLQLPGRLYANYPNWVPPIYEDEWKFHSPDRNPALSRAEVTRDVAYRDGKPVGRVMGIYHRHLESDPHQSTARFFNFDCVDDRQVAHTLLRHVETRASSLGYKKVIGPFGFSEKDAQGLQIEGFKHLPVIAAPSNPPYLPRLLEREGYRKFLDCLSFQLPIPEQLPPLFERIHQRIERAERISLLEFTSKRELKPYIIPTLRLVNETYAGLFGFVQMSEAEMKALAAQYMPVLHPAFVKLAVNKQKEIVGFVVAIPDMSIGIQKAKGRLWPFGFLHLIRAAKRTSQLNVVLGAVRQDARRTGVTVLLAKALFQSATRRGFDVLDSHLVLESNQLMSSEFLHFGGKPYKRFRVFQKEL